MLFLENTRTEVCRCAIVTRHVHHRSIIHHFFIRLQFSFTELYVLWLKMEYKKGLLDVDVSGTGWGSDWARWTEDDDIMLINVKNDIHSGALTITEGCAIDVVFGGVVSDLDITADDVEEYWWLLDKEVLARAQSTSFDV